MVGAGALPASPWLHALFSSSSATLTSLDIHAAYDPKGPVDFGNTATYFGLVASNLLSLTLHLHPFPTPLIPVLSACTRLRHLFLVRVRLGDTVEDIKRNLLLLAASFPSTPTITRLHLALANHLEPNDLIFLLRHPAFTNLTHLDLPQHYGDWEGYIMWAEFRTECSSRGIAVRWATDLPGYGSRM